MRVLGREAESGADSDHGWRRDIGLALEEQSGGLAWKEGLVLGATELREECEGFHSLPGV